LDTRGAACFTFPKDNVHNLWYNDLSTTCKPEFWVSIMFQFLQSGYQAIKSALKKTRSRFASRLRDLFSRKIDEALLDELEEIFYEADFGVKTAQALTQKTKDFVRKNQDASADDILHFLESELIKDCALLDST